MNELKERIRRTVKGMDVETFEQYYQFCLNRGLYICSDHSCYHNFLMDSPSHVVILGSYHGDFVRGLK